VNRSGNIEIGISEGTAARVDAIQRAGIGAQLRSVSEKPDTFDNKVTVHARTRRGDIIIRRAAN
jgi:hypothetical protein